MTTVTIHSKSNCPHCEDAKAFLSSKHIPFVEIKHDDDADRNALYDRFNLVGPARTVPQIIVHEGGEDFRIGGARELRMSGIESLFRAPPKPSVA